jgi:hypothetical protein
MDEVLDNNHTAKLRTIKFTSLPTLMDDGSSQINIWTDAWIPGSPNRMTATRIGNIMYTKVSELIDVETN